VKEHKRQRHDFDQTTFHENNFCNRRPDGIVNNKIHQILYILEFKWSSDQNEDFLGVKDDEVNEQHKSIIEVLKAAAPEWTFEQPEIRLAAGRLCALMENDFYNKLKKLSIHAGKRDKILAAHVQHICEAYDTVIRSYYLQIHWSFGTDATTSMENLKERVYVQ